MKPSIGRVVWYYPANHGDGQPWPALIAYVHSDERINVGGFRYDGTPFNDSDVALYLPDSAVPSEGPYCTWMPYQVSAASEATAKVPAPSSLKPLAK